MLPKHSPLKNRYEYIQTSATDVSSWYGVKEVWDENGMGGSTYAGYQTSPSEVIKMKIKKK